MENMKYASWSFDDIIFEDRNKNYGAYELRQSSGRHSTYGFIITLSFFVLAMLVGMMVSKKTLPPPIFTSVDLSTTDIPHLREEVIRPKPPVSQPPANTHTFIEMNPVSTTPVVAEVPSQQQLVNEVVSETTVETNTPAAETGPVANVETPATNSAPVVINNTPLKWAAVMPSFPGGPEALRKYLASHIKMRDLDIANGVSGKLLIRFYVDVDGSIKEATVIKDNAGGSCAEIALNVINHMPKWNPGMQNNQPVRVYYNIPIVFEVKE